MENVYSNNGLYTYGVLSTLIVFAMFQEALNTIFRSLLSHLLSHCLPSLDYFALSPPRPNILIPSLTAESTCED